MVIVDASVAFKWFDDSETDYFLARNFLKQHLEHNTEIIVPDLILYELTNAWATKTQMTSEILIENISLLEEYLPDPIPVSFKLIEHAARVAQYYGVTVYDAIYVALAKDNKCNLITADEKFVKKINVSFIKLLGK